jgi:hypothetical protein
MQSTRDALMTQVLYAGSPVIRDAVRWVDRGDTTQLIRRPMTGSTQRLYNLDHPSDLQELILDSKMARLFMVVQISDREFNLAREVTHQTQSEQGLLSPITATHLTCLATAPEDGSWRSDYRTAVANLRHFILQSKSPGSSPVGVLVDDGGNLPACKFRHLPFDVSQWVC